MKRATSNFSRAAFLVFPLVIMTILGSCSEKKGKIGPDTKMPPPPAPRVDLFIVHAGPVAGKLDIPGTLMPYQSADLYPEMAGRLTYLDVSEGRYVPEGTLIARIYDGDLKAQLGKLQAQLNVAMQTEKRYEELLKVSGVSQQEYDLIKLEISNIRADMDVVRSNLRRTEIRAPFSGVLGLRMVSKGSYVNSSNLICSIRERDRLRIEFSLPEKYIGKVRKGTEVTFSTEGSDKMYRARIDAMESGIREDNRSLQLRADVIQADKELTAGSFVNVSVSFDPDPTALMVPTQAILPQARGKKIALYKSGSVAFSDIETGIRDTSMIQITKGINDGDTIILTGLMALKPEGKIRIGKIRE